MGISGEIEVATIAINNTNNTTISEIEATIQVLNKYSRYWRKTHNFV